MFYSYRQFVFLAAGDKPATAPTATPDAKPKAAPTAPDSPEARAAQDARMEGGAKTRAQTGADLASLRAAVPKPKKKPAPLIEKLGDKLGPFIKRIEEMTDKLGRQFDLIAARLSAAFGFDVTVDDIDAVRPRGHEAVTTAPEAPEAEKSPPPVDPAKLESIFTKRPGYSEYVQNATNDFGTPQWAIISIMRIETGSFDPWAINNLSSAKGLCQAIDDTWEDFLNAPDNKKFREKTWTTSNGKTVDSRFNPEAAIYFVGWFLNHIRNQINHIVAKPNPELLTPLKGYPEEWKLPPTAAITTEDFKFIALGYFSGPTGAIERRASQKGWLHSEELSKLQRDEYYKSHVEGYQEKAVRYAEEYASQIAATPTQETPNV
jgi:hypothetical protein